MKEKIIVINKPNSPEIPISRLSVYYSYSHTCFVCSYTGLLKEFNDGIYRQGIDVYQVLRCPRCYALQGRYLLSWPEPKSYDVIHHELINYMQLNLRKKE